MGENSKISWCDHTFNPWIGCSKVDQLCKNCYAEKFSDRWGYAEWGEKGKRMKTSDANWKKPYQWARKGYKLGVRYKVFCASLADVMDNHPSILPEWRHELNRVIFETQYNDYLFLTKRPENAPLFLPANWGDGYKNVFFGVSVGDKKGEYRIQHLLNTPAYVRWISAEPLLERFELPGFGIDQIVLGGESGPKNQIRKLDLNVVKYMIDQAKEKGIKVFFKQIGSILAKEYKLADGHGGTFEQYPAGVLDWLKIREIPDSHPSFITIPEPEDVHPENLKLDI